LYFILQYWQFKAVCRSTWVSN